MAPTVDLARIADRSRPVLASNVVHPRAGLDADAALAALTRQRDVLRDVVLAHDGLALGEVIAPNAVLGPLNVYQWVVFAGSHEARHAAQIREIAAAVREVR